ncbi:MAG: response regulator [Ferruginibacter sp.]
MKHKLNCILVIDDDEATNFFTRMMLEESGCTEHIKIAESGAEALEYLTKSEVEKDNSGHYPVPNLIFLDINMPAMNGWEFLEEYKAINTTDKTIVVMLTTSLFPEDELKAANLPQISGFEHKPLTAKKLEAILEKYLLSVFV